LNETTAIEEENMEYNKNMLKHLQEMQKNARKKKHMKKHLINYPMKSG